MNVTAPNLKSLPYTREAVLTLFAPLAQRPWAMLLHSGFAEHPHNRFDILVAEPRTTLTTYSASTEIQQGETRSNSPEDPFVLLQQQLDALNLHPPLNGELPFQGELWGYLAMIWGDVSKRCRSWHRPISSCRIWRWVFMTGL